MRLQAPLLALYMESLNGWSGLPVAQYRNLRAGPLMALSVRSQHAAWGPVWEIPKGPVRASHGIVWAGLNLPMALYCNLGHDGIGLSCHYMSSRACQPGHRVALHVEPRHAGLGLPWHYILSLNTPVWASYSTSFLV